MDGRPSNRPANAPAAGSNAKPTGTREAAQAVVTKPGHKPGTKGAAKVGQEAGRGGPQTKAERSDSSRESTRDQAGRTHEVVIAGIPLRLKSSHDEQTVKELVEMVDRKVRDALPLTKTGSIQNAAILASLNLAEEFLMLKRRTKVELDQLETRAQKVLSELEGSRVTQQGLNNS